jgi:hypothetical protein
MGRVMATQRTMRAKGFYSVKEGAQTSRKTATEYAVLYENPYEPLNAPANVSRSWLFVYLKPEA